MARIVLVHGAWGQAAGWSKVVPALTRLGHAVEALDLPGHGADPAPLGTVTLDDCGRAVAAVLAKGEPAVLVGHSMGGMVISAAAERVPEAIRGLVYVAAFLPRDGDSLTSLKRREPETIGPAIRRGPERGTTVLDPDVAADILFQDATEAERARGLALLGPESNAVQTDAVSLTSRRFGSVPRSYIACTQDRTVTPWLQWRMASESPCRALREIDCGHFPQLTRAEELAALLSDLAAEQPSPEKKAPRP
ncbi:alpha/beta fold hydrolase [Tropicimonas sediminicola]|uniref:Pimeloyl-ACP methyl ester carboxylesterase n=1 Tax=Tropicimonas sediminicola TaxID=1031541 RepID=A0A239JZM8_9RHOB|nr:alpha/beta fold hydrolase [Tropicimonas sediminicola]SNT10244.1 Pimeloyl-ACP methyl ester carboxylesterase [Tropicimonas sediminicola]